MKTPKLHHLLLAIGIACISALPLPAQTGKDVKTGRERGRGWVVYAAEMFVQLFPSSPAGHIFLGRALMLEGRYGRAERELEKGLELRTDSAPARVWLGELHYSRGNYKKAREEFEKALVSAPRSYLAHVRLAQILSLQGHTQDAAEHARLALQAQPEGFEALLQAARLNLLDGSVQRAIETMRRAYAADTENPGLNYQIGALYYETHQYDSAKVFLQRAGDLAPDNYDYGLALGKCLYYAGDFDGALRHLRRAADENADDPEPQYYLGGVLLAEKKYSRAESFFRKAEKLEPGFRDVRLFLGKCRFSMGIYDKAYADLLGYRIARLKSAAKDEAPLKEAMDLLLEIEKLRGTVRRPNQIPGEVKAEFTALIPGGRFQWGGETAPEAKEPSFREVELKPFAIDRLEVSNADYLVFVQAAAWRVPRSDPGGRSIHTSSFDWDEARRTYPEGMADLPVVNVSWDDAVAYAAWAGKRLPTEFEWERAARGGGEKRNFPWGDGPPGRAQACFEAQSPRSVAEAEPNGYGLLHIVGNAAEWCADPFVAEAAELVRTIARPAVDPDLSHRAYRGGHWFSFANSLQVWRRAGLSPDSRSPYVGFRCAADAPTSAKP